MILSRQHSAVLTIPAPEVPAKFAQYFHLARAWRDGFYEGVQIRARMAKGIPHVSGLLRMTSVVEAEARASGMNAGLAAYDTAVIEKEVQRAS